MNSCEPSSSLSVDSFPDRDAIPLNILWMASNILISSMPIPGLDLFDPSLFNVSSEPDEDEGPSTKGLLQVGQESFCMIQVRILYDIPISPHPCAYYWCNGTYSFLQNKCPQVFSSRVTPKSSKADAGLSIASANSSDASTERNGVKHIGQHESEHEVVHQ